MKLFWFAIAVLAFGCKKSPTAGETPAPGAAGPGSGSMQPPGTASDAPGAAPAPPWKIESRPLELPCGDKPLGLPPPVAAAKPAVDRTLAHADTIAQCRDQASVAAACACLAGAIDKWGSNLNLSATGECEPQPQSSSEAQIVEVRSKPADLAATSGGEAFVLVAKHGGTWSAVAVIDAAPDVDLTVTPKVSHRAKIATFESHSLPSGSLYWIESQSEAQEKSMGDLERDGEAQGTICVMPAAASAAPFCYAPLKLGAWTYAFTVAKADQPDACSIRSVATYTATLDAAAATLRVVHGSDADGTAGHYRL